jgi:hypothetical protein
MKIQIRAAVAPVFKLPGVTRFTSAPNSSKLNCQHRFGGNTALAEEALAIAGLAAAPRGLLTASTVPDQSRSSEI